MSICLFYPANNHMAEASGLLSEHLFFQTKARLAVVIAVLSSHMVLPAAQAEAADEYTIKSVLTLNLIRFTDWPTEVFKGNDGTVNLCVLGDDAVQHAFTLIDKKRVGDRMLSAHNINAGGSQLGQCQVLYVSMETNNITQWLQESHKRPILTIGETDGFLGQGGMVYLKMADAKIHLHINLKATKAAGIWISARVLKLATIFNP
ncbi:MAG: hypothetical protein CTY16_16350 [Methylobacter sp.]|nr:MAG: hypothetical protein CTY16_16350 [Methylobacter sp.]